MAESRAQAALREARQDLVSGVASTVVSEDTDAAADAMERAGLRQELGELQELTRVPPRLPVYEFHRWGYDEWHPTPNDQRAFVVACRILLRDNEPSG